MRNSLLLSMILSLFIGCGEGSSSSSSVSSSSEDSGQGGSMARFAIAGDYLYTLNQREMSILDIEDASSPKKLTKIHVPFDVETLFSYGDNLYVGSSLGLYIYDKTIPSQPTRISTLDHVQSCDPVVVSEDIAFVTLSSGSNCWQEEGVNRLEIIDVRTPDRPKLIRSIDMWEPKGLGVDGKNLFICDGSNGLKVYDIHRTEENGTVAVDILLKEHQEEIDCFDLIASHNHLLVSNGQYIRQFDYSSFPMEELGSVK